MGKTIKINNQEKRVELELNKEIYPAEAVRAAAKAFECVGQVDLLSNNKVALYPKDKDTDLNELGYSFCDYVLGLIGNKGI